VGCDGGPRPAPRIIENIMISIIFAGRWEMDGAPAQPPKIIENIVISLCVWGGGR